MKRTERQQHKRNYMKSRLLSIGATTVLVVVGLSLFLWYLQQPPNTPSNEEAKTFLDASQEEKEIEAAVTKKKSETIRSDSKQKLKEEREQEIREEEREKAQAEAEKKAAEEQAKAQAEAKAQAKAEAEAKAQAEAEFDKALADYQTAMMLLDDELDSQMAFLYSQIETLDYNPDYMFTMDFAVSFDEGAAAFYDVYERMSNIQPPPEVEDAHLYMVEAVYLLYEGSMKISDGANQQDTSLMDQGFEDWSFAVNYSNRAKQQIDSFYN